MAEFETIEPETTSVSIADQILIESERMFLSIGYSNASTSDIAGNLGISKKTIYKYFDSKECLLLKVVRKLMESITEQVLVIQNNQELPFTHRLINCVDCFSGMYEKYAKREFLNDIQKNAPAVWHEISREHTQKIEMFEQFLISGKENKSIKESVDTAVSSFIYMYAISSLMNKLSRFSTAKDMSVAYKAFVAIFYTGILTDKARSIIPTLDSEKRFSSDEIETINVEMMNQFAVAESDRQIYLSILQATQELFFQFGFSRVSMDEIAKEIGISKKTLYKHFASKEDLLWRVLETFKFKVQACKQFLDFTSAESFLQSVVALNNYMSEMTCKIGQQFAKDLNLHFPEKWKQIEEWRNEGFLNMDVPIQKQGQKLGVIRKDILAEDISIIKLTIVSGILNPIVLSQSKFTAQTLYHAIFSIIHNGILTPTELKNFQKELATKYS